jgi:hypothetical protein
MLPGVEVGVAVVSRSDMGAVCSRSRMILAATSRKGFESVDRRRAERRMPPHRYRRPVGSL